MIQLIICLVTIAFVAVKAADPPCPDGFSYYGGSCYHVDDSGYYFYQSRDRCELKDSELVAIQSNEENKFIQGLLRGDDATGAWIGVVLVDNDGGQWVNSNTYDEQKFTYWADSRMGSPKALGLTGNDGFDIVKCAYLSKQDKWKWSAKECYSKNGMKSVCKSCTLLQTCTSRTCFRLLCDIESNFDARSKCLSLGGSLASIRSEEESQAVKALMTQASSDGRLFGSSNVWLAGSDLAREGVWYWRTRVGNVKISDGFMNWRDNEPNSGGSRRTDEDCMVMSGPDWRWNDVRCNDYFALNHALCEIRDVNAITG